MSTRTSLRSLAAAALALSGSVALAAGGTITGKVESTPAKFLAETVVYLEKAPPTGGAQSHAMDQRNMTFEPHLLVIQAGDSVKFLNHDSVVHNVYSPDNEGYNLGAFKQNEERSYTFSSAGSYTQLCSIHPEMLGFIFVAPSRHAAAVDKAGGFTLRDVPPGTYKLAIWNSHLKAPAKDVTVTAGGTTTVNFSIKR